MLRNRDEEKLEKSSSSGIPRDTASSLPSSLLSFRPLVPFSIRRSSAISLHAAAIILLNSRDGVHEYTQGVREESNGILLLSNRSTNMILKYLKRVKKDRIRAEKES